MATLAMGSGAVATLAKMFILRPRPNTLKLETATYDYAWIWSFDGTLSKVADFDASTRAFPTRLPGNSDRVDGWTLGCVTSGTLVVRGALAMTMLQRLHCRCNFVSDLFGSAAVGLGWSYICYHPRLMGTLFDKMEPETSATPSLASRKTGRTSRGIHRRRNQAGRVIALPEPQITVSNRVVVVAAR